MTGVLRPGVSEAERQVAGVRAVWPQPAVAQAGVPRAQEAAVQEQGGSAWV